MNMDELRGRIDAVDDELLRCFAERMDIAGDIARYKAEHGLPVLDERREREKLYAVSEKAPEELQSYAMSLYALLFELSRSYQKKRNGGNPELYEKISQAIRETPALFPQEAMVACQGVEGAYSQLACEKIFKSPMIRYFETFDQVFNAIDQGLCKYGVLPLENSTAGSVTKVYDLMLQHDFYIVRSFRLKIDHNLLAAPGTKLKDIREIYSHEQAISQCGGFLHSLKNVHVVALANTAVAAQMVASSGRRDVAAISSRSCMELYGLQNLASSIQDKGNNRTRFICISKNMEIYPGADKTSIMMVLNHKPGALYKVLARIYALGINVTKLESRPIPDRDFEFMFYFDLETSIYSQEFQELMGELEDFCEEFKYLGSFSEVV